MNSKSEKWKSWTLDEEWIGSEIKKKDVCCANSRSEKKNFAQQWYYVSREKKMAVR